MTNTTTSRAGQPIVKENRWKLCKYYLGTAYKPFTATHVREITGASSWAAAQRAIDNLMKIGWAAKANPPTGCTLRPQDAEANWYELTTLGIQGILNSGHAKGQPRPEPYSYRPLYLMPGAHTPRPKQPAAEPEAVKATGSVTFAAKPMHPHLVVHTASGNVSIPADAMRAVYDSLKAIYG